MSTFDALDRAITDGSDPSVVSGICRGLLADILAGRHRLAAVRHPLGFCCLPVVRDGDLGVCIHVWVRAAPGAELTTSTVHCHSWELLSFVLYGRVTHALFEIEDDDSGPGRVVEVISSGDLDRLRPTSRRVHCHERERREIGAGDRFRLSGGQFHSSVVQDGAEAATVVLSWTVGTVDLSIGPPDVVDHQVRRQVCDPAETAQIVRAALAGLAATG